jgi:P-type Ca2+ transporter type 2C
MEKKTNTSSAYYNQSSKGVLADLSSSPAGLTSDEVLRRLKHYGRNELKMDKKPIWKRLLEPFTSVFVVVLLFALVISLVTDHRLDAVIIGVIVTVNALIYYFQQASVERALNALRKHDKSTIAVKRDGKVSQVASENIVPGDIIMLYEGVKVPGDGRLLEAEQLSIDESVLTGESLPVHKTNEILHGDKAVYEQSNSAFKGTFVYSGTGELLITHTGNHTMLGKITRLASRGDFDKSPIEKKIDRLVKQLISIILLIGGFFFAISLLRGLGIEEGLRYTLAIIVSAVPEGLPVALTVVLFLSAKRMAKSKALVKKISSMETLGAVTLIATDKTGTLTKNKLSVAATVHPHEKESYFLQAVAGSINGNASHHGDVLDEVLEKELATGKHKPEGKRIKEYPFNQELRASGSLYKHGETYTLYFKGAPEVILAYSKDKRAKKELHDSMHEFAAQGYRNIAFAHQTFSAIPTKLTAKMLNECVLDGLVGLADSLRRGIPTAIKEAHAAGINVVMLTGDHRVTAAHIAAQANLITDPSQVAPENTLSDSELSHIRKLLKQGTRVFARVLPEHKYKFLQAVKDKEVTAMTGDGINDIPALVEADVGLAMGSGTDATKESSDLVLLNDNFSTIITAIKMGRTVIANIRKMLYYLLSTNLGGGLTMVTAVIAGMPLPLTAVQILWINLVTDGVAVLPLGLSPSEEQQMKHPPRKPSDPILNFELLSRMVVIGIVMAGTTLWLFLTYLDSTGSYVYANTMAFMGLVACQWANALNANFEFRSWSRIIFKPNLLLLGGITLAILLQIVVMFGPLQSTFSITTITASDMLIALIPAALILTAGDMHKAVTWGVKSYKKSHR